MIFVRSNVVARGMPRTCSPEKAPHLDRPSAAANNRKMDPFTGLRAFSLVVETGSFTRAAERLQTAKSSVSETVRALEDRLGVRLLDRTTRKVRVTDAGATLYARCSRLLEDAENALTEVQLNADAPQGALRVATPDGFAARYILPGLADFLNAHPGLDIELVGSMSAARLVEDGLDLAIRIGQHIREDQIVRRLGASRTVIVATPSYLVAHPAVRKPEDVASHRCIGFAPLAWRDTWTIDGRDIAIKPKVLSNETESMRAAALAGLGLVALPEWMVIDALTSGALTRVLPERQTPTSTIYALYPTNRLIAPKVRAFVDHLARDMRARGVFS